MREMVKFYRSVTLEAVHIHDGYVASNTFATEKGAYYIAHGQGNRADQADLISSIMGGEIIKQTYQYSRQYNPSASGYMGYFCSLFKATSTSVTLTSINGYNYDVYCIAK